MTKELKYIIAVICLYLGYECISYTFNFINPWVRVFIGLINLKK